MYEPGSTFKLFTISAALSEGITSLDETFYDPGYRIVDGEKIKCWRTSGHGSQTLVEGLSNSCNSVFMDLGLRLGKEKLYEYLEKFGIPASYTSSEFTGIVDISSAYDETTNSAKTKIASFTTLRSFSSKLADYTGKLYLLSKNT